MRALLLAAAATVVLALPAAADTVLIDLTHPIPTFEPMAGDPTAPDLAKPWLDSQPVPSFGQQTVLAIGQFPVGDGHFDLGRLVLSEHHATHLDMPGHFVHNGTKQIPNASSRLAHESTAQDLYGPVVVIDISARVAAELAKNGGKPAPDKAVTDFSNASMNVVTAADIDAVADQLQNGTWLVLHLGWSEFFYDPDLATSPYINGWNHPGINKEAVDRLIQVMEQKGIKINGLVADNIGIDSGESAIGEGGNWTNSWHAHAQLLQRDIKFVENATNLDQLTGNCNLFVGAIKHVRGTGGASRVIALCES
jgi:kynurenine formamidase